MWVRGAISFVGTIVYDIIHVCVYIYICVSVCVRACVYVYIYIYLCIHIFLVFDCMTVWCICMRVYIRLCVLRVLPFVGATGCLHVKLAQQSITPLRNVVAKLVLFAARCVGVLMCVCMRV